MLIWSTDLKQTLCGVSVDERGLIYVNGMVNKHIYILSAEGKCMKGIVKLWNVFKELDNSLMLCSVTKEFYFLV